MQRRKFLETMALGVPGTIAARRWIGAEWPEGRSPDSGAADHGASGSLVAQNGIYLSQLGFLTSMPKLATINSGGKSFAVRSKRDASIILRNALSNPILDEASGDQVQIADFSARKTPGVYFLEIDDSRKSAAFAIGDDVYGTPLSGSPCARIMGSDVAAWWISVPVTPIQRVI